MRKGLFLSLMGIMMLCSCGKNEEEANVVSSGENVLKVEVIGEGSTTSLMKRLCEAYSDEVESFLKEELKITQDVKFFANSEEADVTLTISKEAIQKALEEAVIEE